MTDLPRAMVTGGAGFIGSTLVDRLLERGWSVLAVDAFEPFYPRSRKVSNLSAALRSPRFRVAEVDTRDLPSLRTEAAAFSPEVIFDLAARAGVRPSLADPQLYIDINVRGLQNTLTVAAELEARVIVASSSSVYGNDARRPFQEDQARGRPESPYGATKIAAEALAYAHHAATGFSVGIARLFTVYGPRQRPDLAIHSFAVRMLRGESIDLYDSGRGVRDYTYVEDVVDALMRLAEAPHPYLLVNVGSGHPITTIEVVQELARALRLKARTIDRPPQPGDVDATYADISRAKAELGWRPMATFASGIDEFCTWLTRSGDAKA